MGRGQSRRVPAHERNGAKSSRSARQFFPSFSEVLLANEPSFSVAFSFYFDFDVRLPCSGTMSQPNKPCRRSFLAATLGASVTFGQTKRKPNFIIVLVDDLGWRDWGCYGHPFHETPQLD